MSRTRPIASAELRALLKVLPDAAALAVRISADTGLRVSDVLSIRSGDLAPTMQVTERKTGKARRVRLRPATLAAARAYASHGHAQHPYRILPLLLRWPSQPRLPLSM